MRARAVFSALSEECKWTSGRSRPSRVSIDRFERSTHEAQEGASPGGHGDRAWTHWSPGRPCHRSAGRPRAFRTERAAQATESQTPTPVCSPVRASTGPTQRSASGSESRVSRFAAVWRSLLGGPPRIPLAMTRETSRKGDAMRAATRGTGPRPGRGPSCSARSSGRSSWRSRRFPGLPRPRRRRPISRILPETAASVLTSRKSQSQPTTPGRLRSASRFRTARRSGLRTRSSCSSTRIAIGPRATAGPITPSMVGSAVALLRWNGTGVERVDPSSASGSYANGVATLSVKASDLGITAGFLLGRHDRQRQRRQQLGPGA